MSQKRQKKQTHTSPAGKALWPHLVTPNTKFDENGTYNTKIIVSVDEAQAVLTLCETAREAAIAKAVEEAAASGKKLNPAKMKRADLPVQPVIDEETGEETGEWSIAFKQKASGTDKTGKRWERKIPLFDAKAKPINSDGLQIWNGSILKVAYTADGFFTAAVGAGCSLRIQAVQILELVSGGSRNATAYGFGEEDGYAHEDETEDCNAFTGNTDEDDGEADF